MPLIDTHCHLDVAAFDADRDRVLHNARQAGVGGFVIPGIDAAGWPGLLDLCHRQADCHPALGLHPVFLDRHQPSDLETLRQQVIHARPLAIGEIGLDYLADKQNHDRQQRLLEQQLELASECRLPVLLHVRKAHDPMLRCLRNHPLPGGIAHAFNGNLQQAHHYLDLGFKLGFGGMLTFQRSRKLRELARKLPQHALVLETDAPDMTVAAHRGERNSPEYLPDCLDALAEVRGEDREKVAEYTAGNAQEVLNFRHSG